MKNAGHLGGSFGGVLSAPVPPVSDDARTGRLDGTCLYPVWDDVDDSPAAWRFFGGSAGGRSPLPSFCASVGVGSGGGSRDGTDTVVLAVCPARARVPAAAADMRTALDGELPTVTCRGLADGNGCCCCCCCC